MHLWWYQVMLNNKNTNNIELYECWWNLNYCKCSLLCTCIRSDTALFREQWKNFQTAVKVMYTGLISSACISINFISMYKPACTCIRSDTALIGEKWKNFQTAVKVMYTGLISSVELAASTQANCRMWQWQNTNKTCGANFFLPVCSSSYFPKNVHAPLNLIQQFC